MSNTFTSLSPLQPSSSTCVPPYVYVYTHICTHVYNLLSPLSFACIVCLCPGLTTWDWTAFVEAYPWRRLSPSQQEQTTCSSSSVSRTMWNCPVHGGMSIGIVLGYCWEVSYTEDCSVIYRRYCLTADIPDLLAFRIFLPFFVISLSLRVVLHCTVT